jgi:hypothetical protein
MKTWIYACALALALAGCKEQASPADTAKNNPQLGTPSAGGGPPGAVTGGGSANMQRQTAAGSPGGPTDDLGGHTDAGPLDAGTDAGPK